MLKQSEEDKVLVLWARTRAKNPPGHLWCLGHQNWSIIMGLPMEQVACGVSWSICHSLSAISGWWSYVIWKMTETHVFWVTNFLSHWWINYKHISLVRKIPILLGNVLRSSLSPDVTVQMLPKGGQVKLIAPFSAWLMSIPQPSCALLYSLHR